MMSTATLIGTRNQPMTKPMRIVIAERRAKMRFAVRIAVERLPGSKMIDETSNIEDLISQARANGPDLAIVAWESPSLPIPEAISTLRRECPHTRVIVLGTRMEMQTAALVAGAHAFVCMGNAPDELMAALVRYLEARPDEPGGERC